MLTDYQRQELARLHQDEMDFIYEIACKYGMTKAEVHRLCCYMHIEYATLQKHELENNHVTH